MCLTISRQSWQGQSDPWYHRCFRASEITEKVSLVSRDCPFDLSFVPLRNEETTSSSTDPYTITGAGFQFLLMNRRSQVWFFIIHLLETRQVSSFLDLASHCDHPLFQQRGEDISEHLIFLFQLSFATFGKVGQCQRDLVHSSTILLSLQGLFLWEIQCYQRELCPTSAWTRPYLAENGERAKFWKAESWSPLVAEKDQTLFSHETGHWISLWTLGKHLCW